MIVKECFPTLILTLTPSTNWADFGLIYIFDKNVPGEQGGSVKKLLHIDICLNWALGLGFSTVLWTFFLIQHILLDLLLYCINKIETIEERERKMSKNHTY